jgi:hypothetical protein
MIWLSSFDSGQKKLDVSSGENAADFKVKTQEGIKGCAGVW